jgi:hypothetical protein
VLIFEVYDKRGEEGNSEGVREGGKDIEKEERRVIVTWAREAVEGRISTETFVRNISMAFEGFFVLQAATRAWKYEN